MFSCRLVGQGGEDPCINSCSPSHLRIYRSNCDAKACIDKYGICQYVTKNANYITKPEKKSKQYEDLLRSKIVNADTGEPPHVSIRRALFDICKRDYGSQETAAITLKHRSVSSSHEFVHVSWKCNSKEVTEGEEPGTVSMRLSDFEVYLNRVRIMTQAKPKSMTVEGSRNYDAMIQRAREMGFLEFAKYFEFRFNPSSKKDKPIEERYVITEATKPHLRVPVPVPDLPIKLRSPETDGHEDYCRFRLMTQMPFQSTTHFHQLDGPPEKPEQLPDSDEEEYCHDEPCGSIWDSMAATALEDLLQKEKEGKEVLPVEKASTRKYHVAYRAYISKHEAELRDLHSAFSEATEAKNENQRESALGDLIKKLNSRRSRVLKIDADLHGGEIDMTDERDRDIEADSASRDLPGHDDFLEETRIDSPVDMLHWIQVRSKYQVPDHALSADWITEQAATADLAPLPELHRVDNDGLNPEQRYVANKLFEQYQKNKEYLLSNRTLPKPMGLVVYGLGGTGKSFVLRAFKQAIDDDNDPLRSTDIDEHAAEDRVLSSDDLVMIMAPGAVAAINVRGDTLHGACRFPRSMDGKKRLDVEDFEKKKTQKNNALDDLQRDHKYTQFYFLDEVGMVGAEQLAGIEMRLGQIHHVTECTESEFGGRSVILFGHHAQLPPPGDKRLFREPSKNEPKTDLQVSSQLPVAAAIFTISYTTISYENLILRFF